MVILIKFAWRNMKENRLRAFLIVLSVTLSTLDGKRAKDYQARLGEILGVVGLTGRRRHTPRELSGGEQQRVADIPWVASFGASALAIGILLINPDGHFALALDAKTLYNVWGRNPDVR